MLDRTRQKADTEGLQNIEFLCVGLGDGHLERERFDRAVLVTVLGEIPDRERAVKEIFDALKPGGLLSVTEIIFDPHFQRYAEVVRMASATGFEEKVFFGKRLAYTMHLRKPDRP